MKFSVKIKKFKFLIIAGILYDKFRFIIIQKKKKIIVSHLNYKMFILDWQNLYIPNLKFWFKYN